MTGVYTDPELNSVLIDTNFNSISCVQKQKMVINALQPN